MTYYSDFDYFDYIDYVPIFLLSVFYISTYLYPPLLDTKYSERKHYRNLFSRSKYTTSKDDYYMLTNFKS